MRCMPALSHGRRSVPRRSAHTKRSRACPRALIQTCPMAGCLRQTLRDGCPSGSALTSSARRRRALHEMQRAGLLRCVCTVFVLQVCVYTRACVPVLWKRKGRLSLSAQRAQAAKLHCHKGNAEELPGDGPKTSSGIISGSPASGSKVPTLSPCPQLVLFIFTGLRQGG